MQRMEGGSDLSCTCIGKRTNMPKSNVLMAMEIQPLFRRAGWVSGKKGECMSKVEIVEFDERSCGGESKKGVCSISSHWERFDFLPWEHFSRRSSSPPSHPTASSRHLNLSTCDAVFVHRFVSFPLDTHRVNSCT